MYFVVCPPNKNPGYANGYNGYLPPAELGTRYLKSSAAAAIWQKKQRRCRYLNKKVVPLPLLAYKTAAAAATLEKYLAKRTMAFKYGKL